MNASENLNKSVLANGKIFMKFNCSFVPSKSIGNSLIPADVSRQKFEMYHVGDVYLCASPYQDWKSVVGICRSAVSVGGSYPTHGNDGYPYLLKTLALGAGPHTQDGQRS